MITGASAGIGEAMARRFAGEGARLVINARREDRLQALARDLGPDRVAVASGDAADDSTVETMLNLARDRFGGGRQEADLVVVNAGRGLRGSVYDSDAAHWEEVIRTNLLAAAKLMRAAAVRMAGEIPVVQGAPQPQASAGPDPSWTTRPRDIIVLGSTVGRHLSPFSSMYGSTKAGVHMLAESLRRTCGPRGVRVSLLEPGIVRSEFQAAAGYDPDSFGKFMDSIGPVLSPEDIAAVALFLAAQPAHVHINNVMIRPTRQEYP